MPVIGVPVARDQLLFEPCNGLTISALEIWKHHFAFQTWEIPCNFHEHVDTPWDFVVL